MRRRTALSLVFLVSLVLTPRPAHAWLGWLDNLSGPGKFRGLQYEFRAICFGEEAKYSKTLREADVVSRLSTEDLVPDVFSGQSRAQLAYRTLADEVSRYRDTTDLRIPRDRQFDDAAINKALVDASALAARLQALTFADRMLIVRQLSLSAVIANEAKTAVVARLSALDHSTADGDRAIAVALRAAERSAQDAAASLRIAGKASQDRDEFLMGLQKLKALSSMGVFISFCGTDKERTSSLDLAYYHWRAPATPEWANNEAVHFDSLMGFYTHRIFRDKSFDVADVAFGGGVYWLTSKGFEGFNGIVLQPIRGDFHAPSNWSASPWVEGSSKERLRRALAIPTARFGFMMFPAGFKSLSFGPQDMKVRPSELVRTWSFFLNLQPLLPRKLK